jgi:hypothetical protein
MQPNERRNTFEDSIKFVLWKYVMNIAYGPDHCVEIDV